MKKLLLMLSVILIVCAGCSSNEEINDIAVTDNGEEMITTYEVCVEDIETVEDASEMEKNLDKLIPQDAAAQFSYVYRITGRVKIEEVYYYFGVCSFVESYDEETAEYELQKLYTFTVDEELQKMYETVEREGTVTWSDDKSII